MALLLHPCVRVPDLFSFYRDTAPAPSPKSDT